jgi:hypothetical protein
VKDLYDKIEGHQSEGQHKKVFEACQELM